MILVDSSIYVDWLRRRVEPHRRLQPWLRSQRVCCCGLIRAEVVRGVVDPGQKERVSEFFDLLPEIQCDAQLWKETADLAWKLDRGGRVLPLTDLVIASCALKVGATVVTLDSHFSEIPHLRSRRDLPLLHPPGV